MKIVVATPPGRFPENRYPCPFPSRWTSLFKDYPIFTFFPYELAYLSSLLKRDLPDASVKLIDGTWLRFTVEDYVRYLEMEKPDWIVFEPDTVTYGETLKIARQIKERTGAKIIMTGQYPTVYPQKTVDDGNDYACIGEYEETVRDILRGDDPKTISGLYPNGHRKLLDIDSLPDPEDEDIRRIDYSYAGGCRWTRYRSIELHASRGCPYSCDFCVAGTVYYEKPNWRFRKPARIINELETLRRKYPEIEGVFFNEETHIVKKRVILEFCDAIIASGNNDLHYEAMANHQLLDEEILEAIKKAGYYKLRIGIETIDEVTSKSIGRKTKADRLEKLLVTAKKLGIEMYGTFIIGASGSTQKGDLSTVEYGRRLIEKELLGSWQASIAVPHPGTPFYEKAVKNGWMEVTNLESFNGISGSVLSYPGYSKEEINKSIKELECTFVNARKDDMVTVIKSEAMKKTAIKTGEREILRNRNKRLSEIFLEGNQEKTIEEALKVLEEFPRALYSRYIIASANKRLGKTDDAKKGFEHIVSVATDYDDAIQFAGNSHFHLAEIFLDEGDSRTAMRNFRLCMHLNPLHNKAREYYWSMLLKVETGNVEEGTAHAGR